MDFDKDELLNELLKNPRINARVTELNLSKEQQYEALIIMLQMLEEEEHQDQLDYLINFDVDDYGMIKKTRFISPKGQRNLYLENIVTLPFLKVDFELEKEFIKSKERIGIVAEFAKYLDNTQKQSKGIYLSGPTNSGKTFLFKRFAKKLAEQNFKVGFVNLTQLMSIFKNNFSSNNLDHENIIGVLCDVKYLFIDGVGSENISSWFRDDIFFTIINSRSEKGLATFFNSLWTIDKLYQVEARTSNQSYLDYEKSKRLISKISYLTNEFNLKETIKA